MLMRIYRVFLQILCTPVFLSDFFKKDTGQVYGVGFWKKCSLVWTMILNNTRIVSGSTFMEHVTMATTLLRMPKEMEGCVVECGTYKGVSATNLSLICKIVGRKLYVCDSFEGLPEPNKEDSAHTLMGASEIHTYEKGQWCGTLDEVKNNIRKYGDISVCEFVKGYFENTLPNFKETCVQVFVDVDYVSSLESCLEYLWPLLQDGGYFYSHEVGHLEISSLFFSESWWAKKLHSPPPGLVGSGTGIGLKVLDNRHYFNSSLGFTIKNPNTSTYKSIPQLGGMKLDFAAPIKLTDNEKVPS